MIRRTLIAVLLLVLCATAAAQEGDATQPDYSKQKLLTFFADLEAPEPAKPVDVSIGAVDFTLFGQSFRFSPLLAPLPGTAGGGAQIMPFVDPFALTGTQIPYSSPPLTWSQRRALRRLERQLNGR